MKKQIFIIPLILTILFTASISNVSAMDDRKITIQIDGSTLSLDTDPIIHNSRTLVPIRGVFEALGATIDWNKSTRQVIVKSDNIEVLLEADNETILMNGYLNRLDTNAKLVDNRMLIPVRFIAESLGHDVDWDQTTRTVIITTKDTIPVAKSNDLPKVESYDNLLNLLNYNANLHGYVQAVFGPEIMDTPLLREDAPTTSQEAEKSDSSETNTQTQGVDEGDLVKTDGYYIYTVSNQNIHIIDPTPTDPTILSTITIDSSKGSIQEIYVEGSKLVVITSSYTYAYLETFEERLFIAPSYSQSQTQVMAYELSDILNPSLIFDQTYDGQRITSRRIDDQLYLVTNQSIPTYNIKQTDESYLLPSYTDNLSSSTTSITYDELYYFPDYITPNILLTIAIDLESSEASVDAYLGYGDVVYASLNHLYLTFNKYEYVGITEGELYVPRYEQNTSIYKFDLLNGDMNYVTSAAVTGRVLNQFSLDEHNNNLRIATTTGQVWNSDSPSKNHLYLLDEDLKQIGSLEDLAPGERIYSTRFYEDRLYMVTFRQVDPLFVIDTSDPENPSLLGDLKIPGFSTYMHILDENHVLGFGTDTYEENGFTRTGGVKISLFDVTDPTAPIEHKNEVIGLAGSYSELQNNHKALMLSLSKGLMAFPITLASDTPYSTSFSGAYIYNITTSDFDYRGSISHKGLETPNYYDYNDSIRRILYIGDYLYTLSTNQLYVTSIDSMETQSTLDLVMSDESPKPVPLLPLN